MSLQSNTVSHWLGATLESALIIIDNSPDIDRSVNDALPSPESHTTVFGEMDGQAKQDTNTLRSKYEGTVIHNRSLNDVLESAAKKNSVLYLASWWRHQMDTFSALLALCAGKSPASVNFSHKGQWCGALMFSLTCAWISGWVNNRKAGDLRRHRAHYDVTVMLAEQVVMLESHLIHESMKLDWECVEKTGMQNQVDLLQDEL